MFTNQGGTAIEDMLFYPWGDVWQSWGSGGYIFAKLPYDDVTTNTNLTTARVNSPNFGRWFTPDPAGKGAVRLDDPQTWNMYAYVRNNPTTLTDPSGLDTAEPLNGSQGPQIESTYGEIDVVVDDTGGHRPASGEKEPESNNQQAQKVTVVFSDNANPASSQPRPGGFADRTVDYQAAKMDQNGHIGKDDIINDATLTLHEKMDPQSKNPHQIIASPAQSQGNGLFKDYQSVKAGEQYRVLRDWKVNGEPAMVYDKASRQTYRYEVTTFDANAKVAIKTEYTNKPPF